LLFLLAGHSLFAPLEVHTTQAQYVKDRADHRGNDEKCTDRSAIGGVHHARQVECSPNQ